MNCSESEDTMYTEIWLKGEFMCTAISYKTKNHYFGRNLDFEHSYKETVTITPRNYPFKFRRIGELKQHYAMIGMATCHGWSAFYGKCIL